MSDFAFVFRGPVVEMRLFTAALICDGHLSSILGITRESSRTGLAKNTENKRFFKISCE